MWQSRKFSSTQLHRLFERLSVLFAAGLPLLQAVQFIADHDEGLLSETMDSIAAKLASGHSFSRCFAGYPELFPPVVPGVLSVAEKVGCLDTALERLANHFQRAERLQSLLIGGLLYPAGIMITALALVAVLVFIVFPREQAVLNEMGRQMPYLSLLAVHSIQAGVVLLGLALAALVGLFGWAERRGRHGDLFLRRQLDGASLAIPVLGRVLQRAAASRMLSVLSSMLEVGVTLTQTDSVASMAQNEVLAERYRDFLKSLRTGSTLDEALRQHTPFPSVAEQMFLLGYEHGQLVQALRKATDLLESEVENSLSTFMALLEPLAMLVVGLVVGILAVATALPTLSLLQGL